MTIQVTKEPINLREKLNELETNKGIKGNEILQAETAQEVRSLIGAGRKNLIINGAMQVAQRGTTFSVVDNIYTVDRWLTEFSGFGAWTLSRSTDAPAGFGYSLDLDCTTADASPAAGDIFQLFHRLEGQDLQQLKKGTSSAESITFSFWVKSKKTGNLQVNLRDANSRIIGAVYTINVADTWEKKSITFAGDTSGVIANDNTSELTLEFPIGSGSTYSSGAVPTSWEATSTADKNAGATINLADNTANYWRMTGLQLELGSTATDFEHRSYGEELALCQRYYCSSFPAGINPANNTLFDNQGVAGWTTFTSTSARSPFIKYPVAMRTAPSLTLYNGSNVDGNGLWGIYTGAWDGSSAQSSEGTNKHFNVRINSGITATANQSYLMRGNWTADAEL